MSYTAIQILDLAFRCAAIGQLVLIMTVYLRRPWTSIKAALLAVAVCAVGYLILTAPVPNHEYGVLRNILLIFTDAFAYSIWLTAMFYFEDDFSPSRWPLVVKVILTGYGFWFIYFFGILAGRGVFHDINHGIAILLFLHVIYVTVRGFGDDLIDRRRRSRGLIVCLASVYGIFLALAEFGSSDIRNSPAFGLVNSGFILMAIPVLVRVLLGEANTGSVPETEEFNAPENSGGAPSARGEQVPSRFRNLKQKLDRFMEEGGYRRSNLTIKALAEELGCPQHHMRQLINTTLGFRNFTAFLNSRRIHDACEQLRSADHSNLPVLTIALDLGYGSIGPFNRAFKAETGQTPTEYRNHFQNRL